MPRQPKTESTDAADQPVEQAVASREPKPASKLDILAAVLRQEGGATVEELCAATGWQTHSVRGAMSGTLKKRGLVITSTKVDGERRYALQPEVNAR